LNKVIGIGKFASLVADELDKHPEYTVYKFSETSSSPDTFALGSLQDMKSYEEEIPLDEIKLFLRSITSEDSVLAVIEGGIAMSGSTLQILQMVKNSELHVLYLIPDMDMLSEQEKSYHKICFGILQEYARSGVLKNFHIVDRPKAEEMVGDVPVSEYERSVANFISYTIAMVNYFSNTEAVLENKLSKKEWCSISSFGLASFDSDLVSDLFSLENIENIHFYYGIPATTLEQDNTLIKKIKSHVKNQKTNDKTISYSVYSTTFDRTMILAQAFTSVVQTV
tara:strand:+ start:80 stop:922 length:843 start_codon:yes stop_codon:yes gene_type:complete